MKKIFTALCLVAASLTGMFAQEGRTQCGTQTGQPAFPLGKYQELPDHDTGSGEHWKQVNGTQVSWGSIDQRYAKKRIPELKPSCRHKIEGWKGERVHAQAVVWTSTEIAHLHCQLSRFLDHKGRELPASAFHTGFVRYVMTDELNKDQKGGCGHRPDHRIYDSTLVADPIDPFCTSLAVAAANTQAIWLDCEIPARQEAGLYKGVLTLMDGTRKIADLQLQVRVLERTLPAPSEWGLHLDLWQNPFAVARYYQVPLWSEEHFEAMTPLFKMLAEAGQKVITTSIMHKPWNGQTEDYFESMVTWTKMLDGSWRFDFDIFDRWVEFMMNLGIDQQINCYTMIPWELSYQYFDQRTNRLQVAKTQPGEAEFEEMWGALLQSLSTHLREKGWFDKTTIAMDERPMDAMLETIKVIRKADEDFKISLAGNWYDELDEAIYDYCIPIGASYPEDALLRRKLDGKKSTYYTCCTEAHPNAFTFSAPAEAQWIGFYCAKEGVDGYLRWAFNSWPLEPLLDSRFRSWAGGDTYLVYPGGRSSIRFERLRDGFQTYEKIRLLQEEFREAGNQKGLQHLEEILAAFRLEDFPTIPAEATVCQAVRRLNRL